MANLDLDRIFKALSENRVDFILVGGIAAIGHGMNYATVDVDLCYQRNKKNYQSLIKALEPSRPKLRTSGGPIPFLFDTKTIENGLNFTLDTDWGPIDLLAEIPGIGPYEKILPRVVEYELYGMKVKTMSLEDLIRSKKAAGRKKDQLHLLELEAIQEIQKKK